MKTEADHGTSRLWSGGERTRFGHEMDRWKEAGKCDCLVRHLGALLHSFPTSRSFLASQIFIGQCRADPLVTTNNRLFLLPTKKCLTYGTRSMKSSPIWRNDDRHSTRHAEKIINRILQLKKLQNSNLDFDNLLLDIVKDLN